MPAYVSIHISETGDLEVHLPRMSNMHTGKIQPEQCALLVCDVQERFTALITGFDVVVDTCRRMVLI